MDPATTAIMVLLSCSPDMLFCRKVSQPAATFPSGAVCEAMLPVEIQRLAGENRIIGGCQLVEAADDRVQWARLPDSTLMTAIGRADLTSSSQIEIDETPTASFNTSSDARQTSFHSQRKSPRSDKEFVTVQVTRMSGGTPTTTSYLVERSE
ncbi:hypothetical protein ACG873_01790 (plasmid) [Mesorhizobium sp. AaZ16]|uniref:hypothetical protein n=1 Tax=Mesorhizobium sp. AaZ16 TaxID=3402289 RepID=UPI00374E9A23